MKQDRQAKILDLIVTREIGTQEELTRELKRAGYQVTQATVSRDIREMQLTKVARADGRLVYVSYQSSPQDLSEKYVRIFRDGFLSMDNAMNILVIRTVSGMAMAVAAALDNMQLGEIVGSIAGDDTVMCAVRSIDDTAALMTRLRHVLEETGPAARRDREA
ncbi:MULTISPECIES: arginine repressor [Shuttleworthella]|uniref:Arginine repressor n=1 Tax=Shuttleworthella satelles DSM 14600 TaxID=626523 RepID=C4GAJ9_9FIRM|nr:MULTISPECIES: arginine repressor [Shuttleworthia]EEP28142.1 arginine repressor [Shuttleworthia satelles DSM 14600]EUB16054.1 arginine repressor [Shuttleworthia sp. MSX8B]